jgi:superfamily I DNA and/or RNA helicase
MIPAAREDTVPDLPPSHWRDVGGAADGHWIADQGRATLALVRQLAAAGLTAKDVFIVTPFRQVAERLRALGLAAGTVHTAQGRQAPAVILVLGGDPSRPGAKSFATDTPNLLNVAVSRAQRRLYVIGDHADWAGARYFTELADALPRTTAPPDRGMA